VTDFQITEVFQQAWQGIRGNSKARAYYLHKLPDAKTLQDGRFLLCQLCAEGGVTLDGIGTVELFGDMNADWRRIRDLALFASATQ
jgi:hypothetical protein